MTETAGLTVFISWSGETAKRVAKVWHRLIKEMFDHVTPWMSEVSISLGTRGLDEIRKTLDVASFGIIIVTRENEHAPWINFEAGALSKALNDNDLRVAPVLVDYNSPAELNSPLKQFQGTLLDRVGVGSVLELVAEAASVDWTRMQVRFDRSWDEYDDLFATARGTQDAPLDQDVIDTDAMIPEILETVRDLKRGHFRSTNDGLTPNQVRWLNAGRELEEGGIAESVLDILSSHGISGARVFFSYFKDRRAIQLQRLPELTDEKLDALKSDILSEHDAMLMTSRITAIEA